MKANGLLLLLVALLLASCGESRYQPTAPGSGSGSSPGTGGRGGSNCQGLTTPRTCLARGGDDVLLTAVPVASSSTLLSFRVPIEYSDAADRRAQAFEVELVGNGQRYAFRRAGDPCPVVPDIAGFNGTQVRDVGTLTGVPAGSYALHIVHALGGGDPCYVPPANADPNALNWLVAGNGTLSVCN